MFCDFTTLVSVVRARSTPLHSRIPC
jgi:hypothetical protein